MRRRTTTILVILAAWTAVAVVFATNNSLIYLSQGQPAAFALALSMSLSRWAPWVPLTPAVVWLARRLPVARPRLWRALPVHFVAGPLCAIATLYLENMARTHLLGFKALIILNNLALPVLVYAVIVAMTTFLDRAVQSRARAAEAEARLSQTQLELLKVQLQPHFLFNALNAIAELVHEDPDKAERMIGLLGDMLRASLDAGHTQLVPLADEVGLLQRYLDIQRTRFGPRLDVRVDVPEDCRTALVPHLCLQPLVENAIRHGLTPRASGGTIWIGAARKADQIVLTVADNGLGLPQTVPARIGITNTRARLASLYNGSASFTLAARPGGGTVATVSLPASASGAQASA